jgi:hypothetical protein
MPNSFHIPRSPLGWAFDRCGARAHACIWKLSMPVLIPRHLWGRLLTCGRLAIGPYLWSGRPVRPRFPAPDTLPPGSSFIPGNLLCFGGCAK